MKKQFIMRIGLLIFILLIHTGCEEPVQSDAIYQSSSHFISYDMQAFYEKEKIAPYTGETSKHIDQVYTVAPKMALTFNGLIEAAPLEKLLQKLTEENISASFFLTAKEITEYRELVKKITAQGHTVESSLMHLEDLEEWKAEDLYREVQKVNQLIAEVTDREPVFSRPKAWQVEDSLQITTAQIGMDAVIGHSIRPRDHELVDDEKLQSYFSRALSRGGIISLDMKDYPQILHAVDYIVAEANEIDYELIPLQELVALDGDRKPFAEIHGADLIEKNLDFATEEPNVFYAKETTEKVVALTFDDYGSDKTVLEILHILDEHDIQSSFFLKAQSVAKNPNLAQVVLEAGHEIANHSYAHKRSTELSPEELQDDLILAHQIITEAIQEPPTMLFRPPFGNIDDETAKVISAVGFHNIAMYDISSYDWNPDYTTEDVINRVMDNVQPGSVIVMHMLDNIKNIETLPIIIDRLKKEEYTFVLMSEWFTDL